MTGRHEKLRPIRQQLQQALNEAATYSDPHLTPEGIAAKRQELRGQAHAKFQPQLEQVQQDARTDAFYARGKYDQTRPALGDDVGRLMRAEQAWQLAKVKLDDGMPLSSVLRTADEITALAVGQWGPAYLEGRAYKERAGDSLGSQGVFDTTHVQRAVDARLAELNPGGAFATALRGMSEADADLAQVAPIVEHYAVAQDGGPTDALHTAIAAHYGAEEARSQFDVTAADPAGDDGGTGDAA